MNKKNYIRFALVFLSVLSVQLVYFNVIAFKHSEIIGSQEAKIDTLQMTINSLQEQIQTNRKQSYVSAHQLPDIVVYCGDTLDLDNQYLRERLEREFYSLLSEQGQIHLYLKRSAKYTEMIEKNLGASGLPSDLKYLAIHESALLPSIKSRSNAVGLWQFMRSSGRLYGLRVNRYIDERRDPEKATIAAVRFLKELYGYYGRWPLVLAAYNGGHGRIQRALKAEKASSFFDLSLPEETERYYFKIVATKILLEDAVNYGINLNDQEAFKPVPAITVNLDVHENGKSLDEIAQKYQMSLAEFKFMNPQYIGPSLPNGLYEIRLPLDKQHLVLIESQEKKSQDREETVNLQNPEVTE